MKIYIKNLIGSTISIDIEPNNSVSFLKQKIEENKGTLLTDQQLIYMGKDLDDEKKIIDYNIKENDVLYLFIKSLPESLNPHYKKN
jgi:hypothetical protein